VATPIACARLHSGQAPESAIFEGEEHNMHGYRCLLGSITVTATLLAPGLAEATAVPAPAVKVSVRVFDRTHKDYHVWDDNEDRAYRGYLGDNHITYRRYSRLKRSQQTTYWNWRHAHGEK
jgi:hypothetical protein